MHWNTLYASDVLKRLNNMLLLVNKLFVII